MSSAINDIAACLAARGYDHEIALIFAREAHERGRLRTAQTIGEAVATVADMIAPVGMWANLELTPRMATNGRPAITTQSRHAYRRGAIA